MVKACFLDRDGTITEDIGYAFKLEDLKIIPGVINGLKLLSKEFIFIIITNQSGIGRGIHTEEDMHKFNKKLIEELKKSRIEIKKIYFCPHAPEQICDCRKPSVKYIKEAAKEFKIDVKGSWVIGDKPIDAEMGKNSGCRTVYMLTGQGKKRLNELKEKNIKPDFIARDFLQAAEFIINHNNKNANTVHK
ncbi:HAD family hydrolase [Candidatus Woesearchaeota archaeon]|nr:HAD family hydrolase [Candidatus Woesearchaeota archaeon]